jgi:hypothetical protein
MRCGHEEHARGASTEEGAEGVDANSMIPVAVVPTQEALIHIR